MNIIVIAYTITAFICFESGLTIFRQNSTSKLNRRYTALALSFSIYSIFMVQFLISQDQSACWLWYRVFTVTACLFSILSVLYFLELTGLHSLAGNPLFEIMLYALLLFFAIPSITFAPIINGFTRLPWGWEILMKKTTWALSFNMFVIGCFICCAVMAVRWRYMASTWREKKQANVIILSGAGALLGLLHLLFSSILTGFLQSDRIHLFNIAGLLFFVFGIRYASVKYSLMTLAPANPASEFFAGMQDLVFITDQDGMIKFTNKNPGRVFGRLVRSNEQKPVFSMFSSGESLGSQMNEMLAGRVIRQPLTLSPIGQSHDTAALDVYLHGIKNEIGEIIGFMIIARENRGLSGIQGEYRLTKRELEIFLLLNDGLSVQEISSECEISLLTAKTHIHNIYSKTGLRNRVELSNLLNKNN